MDMEIYDEETITHLMQWVRGRVIAEVKYRPNINIHKNILMTTWSQIYCKLNSMRANPASEEECMKELEFS